MRVYTTLSGAEGQFHIWAPGLTSDPFHSSKKKKKKGKQKKVKKPLCQSSCPSVRPFGYKNTPMTLKRTEVLVLPF